MSDELNDLEKFIFDKMPDFELTKEQDLETKYDEGRYIFEHVDNRYYILDIFTRKRLKDKNNVLISAHKQKKI